VKLVATGRIRKKKPEENPASVLIQYPMKNLIISIKKASG